MSYTRSFSKQIAVHYSGSVSYPASQSGGTRSYSGTVYETVTVNVHVDTDSFDDSIVGCNTGVAALTGSVVATEHEQCVSITENSRRVGATIISGFFKTVKSEISQQIAALQSRIDSTLIHLRELSRRCVAKQTQMTNDYRRLTDRYTGIFTDLDKELENRIYALDEPTFKFHNTAQQLTCETSETTDGAATVAVGGAEGNSLHARICASVAKRDALSSIRRAEAFLRRQRRVDSLLASVLMPAPGAEGNIYMPVLLVETRTGEAGLESASYAPHTVSDSARSSAVARMKALQWNTHVDPASAKAVLDEYNRMLSGCSCPERVKDYMSALFNLSATAAVSI